MPTKNVDCPEFPVSALQNFPRGQLEYPNALRPLEKTAAPEKFVKNEKESELIGRKDLHSQLYRIIQ